MKRLQIQISPENVSAGCKSVEQILLESASKFNLFDNTVTSRVENTIKSFAEGNGFGFGLGARVARNLIIVDFNPRKTTSQKYGSLCDHIQRRLERAFPERIIKALEDDENYIGI